MRGRMPSSSHPRSPWPCRELGGREVLKIDSSYRLYFLCSRGAGAQNSLQLALREAFRATLQNKAWPWRPAPHAQNVRWPDMKELRRMLAAEALSLQNLKPST